MKVLKCGPEENARYKMEDMVRSETVLEKIEENMKIIKMYWGKESQLSELSYWEWNRS